MQQHSVLGKDTVYSSNYAPHLLYAIPRRLGRDAANLPEILPFDGADIWTGYELSWLDPMGKPVVAVAEFSVPALSPNIIESKSFKLYLNSLNGTHFESVKEVDGVLRSDLSKTAGARVGVRILTREEFGISTCEMAGENIDGALISTSIYDVEPSFLGVAGERVKECLYSDLLKSNCPVTGQPDWASVMVNYVGPKIDRAGLLKYVVSFRNHTGFHEQCVEKMFFDIKTLCVTEKLTVYARYTRRGGLDINPFRSDFENVPGNIRNFRQ